MLLSLLECCCCCCCSIRCAWPCYPRQTLPAAKRGREKGEEEWSSQKLTRHLAVALIGAARLGQIRRIMLRSTHTVLYSSSSSMAGRTLRPVLCREVLEKNIEAWMQSTSILCHEQTWTRPHSKFRDCRSVAGNHDSGCGKSSPPSLLTNCSSSSVLLKRVGCSLDVLAPISLYPSPV